MFYFRVLNRNADLEDKADFRGYIFQKFLHPINSSSDNPMPQTQSELRIFISSTFQDLQEEREYLVKKVFPEIRQLCRERGVKFTEIDLRWGLTEEEATQGKVIRTCLEEIDRCRPYFIGIIGSRYGWTPKYSDIQRDGELLHKYS